jgi:hypothetical protein
MAALSESEHLLEEAAKVMQYWGNEMARSMEDKLNQRLKNTMQESNLAQSIHVDEDSYITKDSVSLTIELNDYYVFVDLGVRGMVNKDKDGVPTKTYTSKEFPGGFSFHNLGYSQDMINALQLYIARKPNLKKPIRKSPSQKTSEVIEDSFAAAKTMAYFIKKKGLDGTLFYTETFTDAAFNDLVNRLEFVLGNDIELQVTQHFKDI